MSHEREGSRGKRKQEQDKERQREGRSNDTREESGRRKGLKVTKESGIREERRRTSKNMNGRFKEGGE